MCDWGTHAEMDVPIQAFRSHTGERRVDKKKIDRCIAPMVRALLEAGCETAGSCCGHGSGVGFIAFAPEQPYAVALLVEDMETAQAMENFGRALADPHQGGDRE